MSNISWTKLAVWNVEDIACLYYNYTVQCLDHYRKNGVIEGHVVIPFRVDVGAWDVDANQARKQLLELNIPSHQIDWNGFFEEVSLADSHLAVDTLDKKS